MKESGVMIMKNMNFLKKNVKKVIAALMSAVTAVTYIPTQPVQAYNPGNNNIVNKSLERAFEAGLKNNSGRDDVIRAVLDNIEELPQYGNVDFTSLTRGTPERPFLILEIVQAEECGEFGYLVGGCEPIRVEDAVYSFDILQITQTLNTADWITAGGDTYFFMDEPEGTFSNYSMTFEEWNNKLKDWGWPGTTRTHKGYYQYVGKGKGYFSVEGDSFVNKGKGNGEYIWHTVNSFEMDEYTEAGMQFNDSASSALGTYNERIYTTRQSFNKNENYTGVLADNIGEPVVNLSWYYKKYENKENFIRDTLLRLGDEVKYWNKYEYLKASNYSCVIKTITPDELNKQTDWIDYADLIYISPQEHNAASTYWKKTIDGEPANRLGHTSDKTVYNMNDLETNDISAEAVLKIFNRIASEENHAAVMLDDRLFNMGYVVTDKTKNKSAFDLKVYTWDMFDTGLVQNVAQGAASSCNFFKLCLMLTTLNPDMIKEYFVDRGLIKTGEDNFSLVFDSSYQTGDASKYWSFYSLQMIDKEYYEKYKDDYQYKTHILYRYADDDDNWEKYGSVGEHITNYKQSVRNHVYAYPGDNSVAMNYVGGTINSDNSLLSNGDYRFKEFRDALDTSIENDNSGANQVKVDYESGKADSSDAVRYILGIMDVKRQSKEPDISVEKAYLADDAKPKDSDSELEVLAEDREYTIDLPGENTEEKDYIRIYFRPRSNDGSKNIDVNISYNDKDGNREFVKEIWSAEADYLEEADTLHAAKESDSYYIGLRSEKLYYFLYKKSDIVADLSDEFLFNVTNIYYTDFNAAVLNLNLEKNGEPPVITVEKANMASGIGAGQASAYELNVEKEGDSEYSIDVPDEYADYVRIYFRPWDVSFSDDVDVCISYIKKDGSKGCITEIWTGEASADEPADNVHTAGDGGDYYFKKLNSDRLYYFYYKKSDIKTVSSVFAFEAESRHSDEAGTVDLKLNLQSLYYLD